MNSEKPTRKRASGAGVKPDDGAQNLQRKQILIDASAEAIFLALGGGNLSLGVREAARRVAELGDALPFDRSRHESRPKR